MSNTTLVEIELESFKDKFHDLKNKYNESKDTEITFNKISKSKLSEAEKDMKKFLTDRANFLRKKVQEAEDKIKYLKQNRVHKKKLRKVQG